MEKTREPPDRITVGELYTVTGSYKGWIVDIYDGYTNLNFLDGDTVLIISDFFPNYQVLCKFGVGLVIPSWLIPVT